ncbi:hypothetical protein [Amylolactobacillus amylophilus]|uniref:hypothetical protein n=1 Tax=Amylolactobacillus amylophilus TaxID=1603 RepID=UPI00209229B3|nr:hypothetical protein [Amylolactobacillus amylophilus]
MTTIVGQDKEYQFSGSSHGIRYTWQFAGKQVKNSVAQKLGLTLQQNVLQNIKRAANDAPYALAINVQDFALAAQLRWPLLFQRNGTQIMSWRWSRSTISSMNYLPLKQQSKRLQRKQYCPSN